jgi:hypothetical protein
MTDAEFDRLSDWNKAVVKVSDMIANRDEEDGPVDEATRKRWIEREMRSIQEDRLRGKRAYPSVGVW